MKCKVSRATALFMVLVLMMCSLSITAYANDGLVVTVYEEQCVEDETAGTDESDTADYDACDNNDIEKSFNDISKDEQPSDKQNLNDDDVVACDDQAVACDEDCDSKSEDIVAEDEPTEDEYFDEALLGATNHAAKYITEWMPKLKGQGSYDTCWAFAATGMAEINMMKNTGREPDYSEAHLSYFAFNDVEDPLLGTVKDYIGIKNGYDFISLNTAVSDVVSRLTGWIGLADENVAPYGRMEEYRHNGIDASQAFNDAAYVTNAEYEFADQIGDVKDLVEKYGAAILTYQDNEDFYNAKYNSYYCSDYSKQNHVALIVGWDDGFSKNKFGENGPLRDGAWLIRNSWYKGMDEYCHDGYFWMSYYDKSIYNAEADVCAFEVVPADNFDNNYQYDGSCFSEAVVPRENDDQLIVANVFRAHANDGGEELRSVSFLSYCHDVDYEVSVYVNRNSMSHPEDGVLKGRISGHIERNGNIALDLSPINLNKGDYFSVVVRVSGASARDLALAGECSGERDGYRAVAAADSGQSYMMVNNEWRDYGYDNNANLRIKAFSVNVQKEGPREPENKHPESIKIMGSDTVKRGKTEQYSIVAEPQDYEALGIVEYESSDTAVLSIDSQGNATGHKVGYAIITATLDGVSDSMRVLVPGEGVKPTIARLSSGAIRISFEHMEDATGYEILDEEGNVLTKIDATGETRYSYVDKRYMGQRLDSYVYSLRTLYLNGELSYSVKVRANTKKESGGTGGSQGIGQSTSTSAGSSSSGNTGSNNSNNTNSTSDIDISYDVEDSVGNSGANSSSGISTGSGMGTSQSISSSLGVSTTSPDTSSSSTTATSTSSARTDNPNRYTPTSGTEAIDTPLLGDGDSSEAVIKKESSSKTRGASAASTEKSSARKTASTDGKKNSLIHDEQSVMTDTGETVMLDSDGRVYKDADLNRGSIDSEDAVSSVADPVRNSDVRAVANIDGVPDGDEHIAVDTMDSGKIAVDKKGMINPFAAGGAAGGIVLVIGGLIYIFNKRKAAKI